MTLRLQNLMLAMLLALTTLFVGFGTLSQNPASGGYQLFERAVSGISADIQLASLENFASQPETASEYAIAPKGGVDPRDVGGINGVRPHQDGPAAGGRKPQYRADGGLDQAKADFESAVGGQYTALPNGNLRGTGPNGENIIFNPQSSGGLNPNVTGPPTIYVDGAAIRYD